MSKKTYSDLLRDPRWQKKRLEVMQYANFRCQICGDKTRTQNVHHSYYENGRMPWEYPNGSMICTCEKCHKKIHGKKQARAEIKPEPVSKEKAQALFEQTIKIVEGMK